MRFLLNWIRLKKPSVSSPMKTYTTNFNSGPTKKPAPAPKPKPQPAPQVPKVKTGNGFALSARDQAHLKKLHPDLARVVRRAAADWALKGQIFFITCSLRTMAEQKALMAAGATRTLRSRHLPGRTTNISHAVDLAVKLNGTLKWDWPLYANLAKAMKAAAIAENVPIEWGGDWKSFKDGPHFQLPWATYPG